MRALERVFSTRHPGERGTGVAPDCAAARKERLGSQSGSLSPRADSAHWMPPSVRTTPPANTLQNCSSLTGETIQASGDAAL